MATATPVSHATYDLVPYHSDPFPHTHPSHLATIGVLFGMSPPPVGECRLLELGCAGGGNLIPMAQELPGSSFLGVDLSARQVQDGQRVIGALGLANIELRHASITDVGPDEGLFDYIVCHGVYSWVPRAVQDKIIEICHANLKPNGIAYVSYNTYPGWHLRGVVRDMMRYHVAQFEDPATKVRQARSLLDFLIKSAATGTEAYGKVLADEAQIVRRHSDTYLFHEHLEENNEPCYFHEFVDRATAHQLQYLGEAEFPSMLARNFKAETFEILQAVPMLRQEQYMDFLRNRMFRRTLLVHRNVELVRNIPVTRICQFHLAVVARLEIADPRLGEQQPVEFKSPRGTATVKLPISKAALVHLNRVFPRCLAFDTLFEAARELLGPEAAQASPDTLRRDLANDLTTIYAGGLLQAWIEPPAFADQIGERPTASPLARLQARSGARVTNLRHEAVVLEGFSRHVVAQLDGQRDRRDLLHSIQQAMTTGELEVTHKDQKVTRIDEQTLGRILESTLQTLVNHALIRA
jgi:methyltransferase-like protein/2-polyprenyl-3-methyl-5-hydroxy-6-metoxy-1,4-benzoquinol methylase